MVLALLPHRYSDHSSCPTDKLSRVLPLNFLSMIRVYMFSNCQDDIFIYLQINYSGATDLGYDSKNARHPIFFCHEIFSFPTCAKGYTNIQSLHESTGSDQTC